MFFRRFLAEPQPIGEKSDEKSASESVEIVENRSCPSDESRIVRFRAALSLRFFRFFRSFLARSGVFLPFRPTSADGKLKGKTEKPVARREKFSRSARPFGLLAASIRVFVSEK